MGSLNLYEIRRLLEPRCFNPEYWRETSTSRACHRSERDDPKPRRDFLRLKKELDLRKEEDDATYFASPTYFGSLGYAVVGLASSGRTALL